eukprot:snap_masked-scaffold_29-processed-gene-0.30-mRNA-1 protein AED:1.00 eAED:1.00 QI:0/0/0/0/1/1/3/0/688
MMSPLEEHNPQDVSVIERRIPEILHKLKKLSIQPGACKKLKKGTKKTIKRLLKNLKGLFYFRITFDPKTFEILNNEPACQFIKIFLNEFYNETHKINETKLVFLGDGKAGKTSTIRSLTRQKCYRNYPSTPFLDLQHMVSLSNFKKVNRRDIIEDRVKSNQLSRAAEYNYPEEGSNRYSMMRHEMRAHSVITDHRQNSDLRASGMVRALSNNLGSEQSGQVRVGSTNTFFCETFHDDVIDLVKEKYIVGFQYFSPPEEKEKHFLRIFDFGGQKTFHCIHQLFLSDYGIYVIVFNAKSLDRKNCEKMRIWCESLLLNAPKSPVLFVGTYWKKALERRGNKAEKQINSLLRKMIKSLTAELQVFHRSSGLFLPIENSSGPNSPYVEEIQACIKNALLKDDGTFSGNFKEKLTMAQILFMDFMQQSHTYITRSRFFKLAAASGLEETSVDELLTAYSTGGLIIHEQNVKCTADEDSIIALSPSKLASTLSSFIYDPQLHTYAYKVSKHRFRLYRSLLDNGIMHKDLIEDVLRNESQEDIDFIIALAVHMHILLKFPLESVPETQYLMPPMFPELTEKEKKIVHLNFLGPVDYSFFYSTHWSPKIFPLVVQLFMAELKEHTLKDHIVLKDGFCRISFKTNIQCTLICRSRSMIVATYFHGDNKARIYLTRICRNVEREFRKEIKRRVENLWK